MTDTLKILLPVWIKVTQSSFKISENRPVGSGLMVGAKIFLVSGSDMARYMSICQLQGRDGK